MTKITSHLRSLWLLMALAWRGDVLAQSIKSELQRAVRQTVDAFSHRDLQFDFTCTLILPQIEMQLGAGVCTCLERGETNIFDISCPNFCTVQSTQNANDGVVTSVDTVISFPGGGFDFITKEQTTDYVYSGSRTDAVQLMEVNDLDGTPLSCALTVGGVACTCSFSTATNPACAATDHVYDCSVINTGDVYDECGGGFGQIPMTSVLALFNENLFPIRSQCFNEAAPTSSPSAPQTAPPTSSPTIVPAVTSSPTFRPTAPGPTRAPTTMPPTTSPRPTRAPTDALDPINLNPFTLIVDADGLQPDQLTLAMAGYLFQELSGAFPELVEMLVAISDIGPDSRRKLVATTEEMSSMNSDSEPSTDLAVDFESQAVFATTIPDLSNFNLAQALVLQDTSALQSFLESDSSVATRIDVVTVETIPAIGVNPTPVAAPQPRPPVHPLVYHYAYRYDQPPEPIFKPQYYYYEPEYSGYYYYEPPPPYRYAQQPYRYAPPPVAYIPGPYGYFESPMGKGMMGMKMGKGKKKMMKKKMKHKLDPVPPYAYVAHYPVAAPLYAVQHDEPDYYEDVQTQIETPFRPYRDSYYYQDPYYYDPYYYYDQPGPGMYKSMDKMSSMKSKRR